MEYTIQVESDFEIQNVTDDVVLTFGKEKKELYAEKAKICKCAYFYKLLKESNIKEGKNVISIVNYAFETIKFLLHNLYGIKPNYQVDNLTLLEFKILCKEFRLRVQKFKIDEVVDEKVKQLRVSKPTKDEYDGSSSVMYPFVFGGQFTDLTKDLCLQDALALCFKHYYVDDIIVKKMMLFLLMNFFCVKTYDDPNVNLTHCRLFILGNSNNIANIVGKILEDLKTKAEYLVFSEKVINGYKVDFEGILLAIFFFVLFHCIVANTMVYDIKKIFTENGLLKNIRLLNDLHKSFFGTVHSCMMKLKKEIEGLKIDKVNYALCSLSPLELRLFD